MKYLGALVALVLAASATLVGPPMEETFGEAPGTAVPPISICPIVQVGGNTTVLSVLSSVNGVGRLSTFAAGQETGSTTFRTGGSGSVLVPASEAGAVGVSGALIEMPSDTTASGVIIGSDTTRASETCGDVPAGQTFMTGGSTASGDRFEVNLVNPYAGGAVVDMTVTSDAGIESDDRFDAVVVPALSSQVLDLSSIIPGRESISIEFETTRGSVLIFGRLTTDGDTAVWRAVPPGLDWWLPVPPGGPLKQLLLASPNAAEIEYQLDLYGPDGFTEAAQTGTIPARGQEVIGLAAISDDAYGLRLITSAPVVPTFYMNSASGLAATTASQTDAPLWLLPGASGPAGGSGQLVMLNSGLEPVSVAVRTLQEAALTRNFEVPSEGVQVVDLVAADGYRVEADGPVVAMWVSNLGSASTAAIGVPIQDG